MTKHGNTLFPIFVKLDQIDTLIVGGGNVGLEKLEAILRNSPEALVTMVADRYLPEVEALAASNPRLHLHHRRFETADLDGRDLVICATDNPGLHAEIREEARRRHILINVADTPALCDFYLSSVVIKDDLKIAISTNGKSPTLAKRIRALLEETLPDSVQEILDRLKEIRQQLKGDFAHKVEVLNEVTSSWLQKSPGKPTEE